MRGIRKIKFYIIVAFVGLWANNTSIFVSEPSAQKLKLLAHRGVQKNYAGEIQEIDNCKAAAIERLKHSYIESTLPSIKAALSMAHP